MNPYNSLNQQQQQLNPEQTFIDSHVIGINERNRNNNHNNNLILNILNDYTMISKWTSRHLTLECLILIVSFYMVAIYPTLGVWLFLGTLCSVIGCSIVYCCCPTRFGWTINLVFQLVAIFVVFIIFIVALVSIGKNHLQKTSIGSLAVVIVCSLFSFVSLAPFVYLSSQMINNTGLQVVPQIDTNNNQLIVTAATRNIPIQTDNIPSVEVNTIPVTIDYNNSHNNPNENVYMNDHMSYNNNYNNMEVITIPEAKAIQYDNGTYVDIIASHQKNPLNNAK